MDFVDAAPCQTVSLEVTVCDNTPWFIYRQDVSVFSKNGIRFFRRSASTPQAAGCKTTTLPATASEEGAPLPGGVGPSSLAASATVELAASNPALAWTIVVHRVSTVGYNVGGTDFASAALLTPLPATVRSRFTHYNDPEHFRVRLAGNGTLSLTGTIRKDYVFCCSYLQAAVPATPSSTPFELLALPGKSVSGGTVSFTSNTYTNPSAQPAEVFLRLRGYNRSIEDAQIQVIGTEGPRLTIYLNADSNFSTITPQSDHPSYIPGAALATGLSVPLPQSLEVIAAYTNSAGAIVPPPAYASSTVTFDLLNTSAYAGYAMNAGAEPGPDPAKDFAFLSTTGTSTDTLTDTFDLTDYTARVSLQCHDYGGRTRIRALDGVASTMMDLPLDDDGNGLPDAGWKEIVVAFQTPDYVPVILGTVNPSGGASDDTDDDPSGNGATGDNLSRFEEYRGFVTLGIHTRTHPSRKDVFVSGYYEFGLLQDAVGTGLVWRPVRLSELSLQRVINFNAGVVAQQAVVVFDGGISPVAGWLGSTPCPDSPFVCYPNMIGATANFDPMNNVLIYETSIRRASPPTIGFSTPDPIDDEAFRAVWGHELGHSVGVDHNFFDAESIMISVVTFPNLQHSFTQWDRGQVRVK